MAVLNKKLFRDIYQSWQMLLAVSAIISVGVGCFIGMMSAAQNLEFARSSYYSTCRLADFWLDLKKVPVQEAHRIAMLPGVSEIRDRIQFNVLLDLEGVPKPITSMVLSLPDEKSPVINNIILRRGTYFTSERANEVIVSDNFAKARGIEPGDRLTAILNNQRKELVVTGTAISAEFVYVTSPGSMVNEPGSYGLIYIKRSFAEETFGFNSGCNSVMGLLTPEARENPDVIVEALSERFSSYGVFAALPRKQQFSPMVLDGELSQLRSMGIIFPMFFLVVAALVLNVLMIRLTEQQRTVIGTLKAIGYDNRSLMFHFLKFAAVTGLVGGLLGCLLGYWLGGAMTKMYVEYFSFPQLTNRFYPWLLLAGVFTSIAFSIFGTIKGVRQIMRLEPAEAMRQASPATGGAVILEKIPFFWKQFDAQWHMILRGVLRNKGRTLVAIFAATMGASIVVLAFGFVDSINQMVSFQFERSLVSDYHLTFNSEIDYQGLNEIRALPGVIHAEPVFTMACTFENANHSKKGGILGIEPNGLLTIPLDSNGQAAKIPPAGLLMARRLMEQLHVKPGDYVSLIPVKGDRRPRKVPVMGGIESMMGLAVFADYSWLNKVLGQQEVISEVRIQASHNRELKEKFLHKARGMPGLEALTDLNEQKEALNKQLDGAMRAMAMVMVIFAAVIFFGTILNGTLIAISERRREMATFRTMGYYNREVSRLFLRENLLTNVTGTLIGLPLGYWLLVSAMEGFVTDAYSFSATLTTASYVYTLLLSILFVLISQIFVVRILKKQNWVEAMSLKE